MNLHDCDLGVFPLHPTQERIYLAQALDFSDPRFNIGGYLEISGMLDVARLRAAIETCWLQSDTLRTNIFLQDGKPVQRLGSLSCAPSPQLVDLRGESDTSVALATMQANMDSVFNFHDGSPLVAFEILRVADQRWFFFSKYHLLIADAATCGIVVNNIIDSYLQTAALDQPPYLEAIIEAQDYLQSSNYHLDQLYWHDWLAHNQGALTPLFSGQREAGGDSRQLRQTAPHALIEQLTRIGQQTGASIIQLSLAALAVCFHQIEGRSAWVAGIPLHNRTKRSTRRMIGPLVNSIPSLIRYQGEITLRQWLDQLKLATLNDMRHRAFPLHHLERAMHARGHLQSPFDVIINYNRMSADIDAGDLKVSANQLISSHEKVALHLRWNDYGPDQPLHLSASHNLALLDTPRTARLLACLFQVMAGMEEHLDRPLAELSQLSEPDMAA